MDLELRKVNSSFFDFYDQYNRFEVRIRTQIDLDYIRRNYLYLPLLIDVKDFIPNNLNRINSINLDFKELPDNLIEELSNNKTLTKLILFSGIYKENSIIKLLKELRINRTLRKVEFGAIAFDINGGFMNLANVIRFNKTLSSLKLWNARIDDSGIIELADALRKNNTLKSLSLGHNFMGDFGISALADVIRENKSLIFLMLDDISIKVDGAIAIAEALRENKTLHYLDLYGNYIENDGAIAIAEALRENNTLEYLNIRKNFLGYDGKIALQPYSDRVLF